MTIPAPDWQDQIRMHREALAKKHDDFTWDKLFEPNYVPYKHMPKPDKKEKPDPKLLVVDITTDELRALLEYPEKGVQVIVNDEYVVLIREV